MGNAKEPLEQIKDKDELLEMMHTQLNYMALQYILEDVNIKTLQQMVVESKLNIKTSSKPLIVQHLVEMKDYVPPPKKEPKNKRPPAAPKPPKPAGKENKAPARKT